MDQPFMLPRGDFISSLRNVNAASTALQFATVNETCAGAVIDASRVEGLYGEDWAQMVEELAEWLHTWSMRARLREREAGALDPVDIRVRITACG